jgi:hypothetical protein
MSYIHVLEITAHWAAILTALVAAGAYVLYRWDIHSKRIQLENYLKAEKAAAGAAGNKGQRSILHLMARLGLSEAELLQASFGSKHIVRRIAADPGTRRADAILLEYVDQIRN